MGIGEQANDIKVVLSDEVVPVNRDPLTGQEWRPGMSHISPTSGEPMPGMRSMDRSEANAESKNRSASFLPPRAADLYSARNSTGQKRRAAP